MSGMWNYLPPPTTNKINTKSLDSFINSWTDSKECILIVNSVSVFCDSVEGLGICERREMAISTVKGNIYVRCFCLVRHVSNSSESFLLDVSKECAVLVFDINIINVASRNFPKVPHHRMH